MRIAIQDVLQTVRNVLEVAGLPKEEADLAAQVLVDAEARGKKGHGLIRLRLELDRIRSLPRKPILVDRESPIAATIDGGGLQGYIVGSHGVQLAASKARVSGMAAVAIHSVGHTGHLGYFVRELASRGLVGLAFSHCLPLMAVSGSRESVLGTNPIAASFPLRCRLADEERVPVAFVSDVSTSALTRGQILLSLARGVPIAEHAALDEHGEETTDPSAARVLLPLGGHKGAALAIAIQALCICAGGLECPPPGVGYALLLIAIRPDLFIEPGMYDAELGKFLDRIRSAERQTGVDEILLPGEGSERTFTKSIELGIDVDPELWKELSAKVER